MARSVVCAVTKKRGTSDTFVKIGTKYYKSQEIYDADCHQKNMRAKVIDYICDEFLNYQKGQVFPGLLIKKLKELDFYSYDVIMQTLENKTEDIHYWLNKKNIDSDNGKIAYLFGIVKGCINEELKKYNRNEKRNISEVRTSIEAEDVEKIGSFTKGKDISIWLGDDEI